jgi:hypothetical protein
MARKSSSRARPLALEILEADHRKVETLFKQYEQERNPTRGPAPDRRTHLQ